MGLKHLCTQSDFDEVQGCAGDRLIIVFFTATWCTPCQAIKPTYHDMAEKETYNAVFCEVDVDTAAELVSSFDITCMPTFVFVKKGVKLDRMEGSNQRKLTTHIEQHE